LSVTGASANSGTSCEQTAACTTIGVASSSAGSMRTRYATSIVAPGPSVGTATVGRPNPNGSLSERAPATCPPTLALSAT
jgi:hypothetical protein